MRIMLVVVLSLFSALVNANTEVNNFCSQGQTNLVMVELRPGEVVNVCYDPSTKTPSYLFVKDKQIVKTQHYQPGDVTLITNKDRDQSITGYHLYTSKASLFFAVIKNGKETVNEMQYWKDGELLAVDEIPPASFKLTVNKNLPVEHLLP